MRDVVVLSLLVLALACTGEGSPAADALPEAATEAVADVAAETSLDPGAEPLPEPTVEPTPDVLDAPEAHEVLPSDTGPDATATVPLPGFGVVTGDCGVLDDAVWASSQPLLFVNHLDFATDPYDDADYDRLTSGGQKVLDDDNAGGSSKFSEAFAYEVLARCEVADLLKTELEIDYQDAQGKITDLLVRIDDRKVGVSVTRAMSWPLDAAYSPDAATALLTKKLEGIQASTANVAPDDRWVRQVLAVLAYGDAQAQVLGQAWSTLPADVRADTIVLVTISDGDDAFLY